MATNFALIITFQMIHNLPSFAEVIIFRLFLVMTPLCVRGEIPENFCLYCDKP